MREYSNKFSQIRASTTTVRAVVNALSTANVCHQCGQQLNLSQEQDSRRNVFHEVDDSHLPE